MTDAEKIRADILTVLVLSGPVTSPAVAKALRDSHMPEISNQSVASHLGYMRKQGIVKIRNVTWGRPREFGPYIIPANQANLWYCKETVGQLKKVVQRIKSTERLPLAKFRDPPMPRTGDMIQMLDDLKIPH